MSNYKHIVIFNSQAFGDALVGTHLARLFRDKYPKAFITFAIPSYMNLTTSSSQPEGLKDIVNILSLQYGIDNISFLRRYDENNGELKIVKGKEPNVAPDLFIEQKEWWGDLGLAGSAVLPYYLLEDPNNISREILDTETSFSIGTKKELPEQLTVVTQGPFEWGRKLGNEQLQKDVVDSIRKKGKVIELDVKCFDGSYLEALQIVNNCHLFIGPAGSMAHAAAGLGVDTITIASVFPEKYDTPIDHKDGYHLAVVPKTENHCGSYKCLTKKDFSLDTYNTGIGNPPVYDFWAKKCEFLEDGNSCVSKYTSGQILRGFDIWFMKKWLK
tara:strand:+ start:10929 stop:11912 length:984 start_codon:yes stop_codon:yes gene_type:complete